MKLPRRLLGGLSRNVLLLGLVSMLTDVSSEMIFPLLPLFLVNILRTDASIVGLIEGIAESSADIMKMFSGWWSDKMGKRKPFVLAGYGLSTMTKPLFALAATWQQVMGVRFTDRLGKGLRVSARDVMIVESTEARFRGKAFGFRKMMDSLGAVIGPLIAFALLPLFISATDPSAAYRGVFWLSVIPAVLAVILLLFVKETEPKNHNHSHYSFKASLQHLGPNFNRLLFVSVLLALSNFSAAFMVLRAHELGYGIELVPLLYVAFNITYAAFAIPAGSLSDRIGRKPVLAAGHALFALTCLGFAFSGDGLGMWILFALYGIFLAIRETLQRAFIADMVDDDVIGTAFGSFQAAVGIAALPASVIAGILWQVYGSQAAFIFGAAIALISAVLLVLMVKEKR